MIQNGDTQGQKAEGGLTPSVRTFLGNDGKSERENKHKIDNKQKNKIEKEATGKRDRERAREREALSAPQQCCIALRYDDVEE